MPPDKPQLTSPATNDELAVLYLRDRDTPCPSCNYNRRDGTTSTCPECATELALVGINSMFVPKYDKLAKAGLLIGTILAFFKVVEKSYTIIFPFIRASSPVDIGSIANSYPTNLFYLVMICAYFLWIALFVIVLKRLLTAQRGNTITMKKIIRPIAAMLLLYVCESVFFTLASIFIF